MVEKKATCGANAVTGDEGIETMKLKCDYPLFLVKHGGGYISLLEEGADPETSDQALANLKQAITDGGNGFEALMQAVRHCSLGQLTDAFFEVGGQYRRNT